MHSKTSANLDSTSTRHIHKESLKWSDLTDWSSDKTYICSDFSGQNVELSFREVDHSTAVLADRLHAFLENNTRVALLSGNSVDSILIFLSLQRLGKEVLMLNTRLKKLEIESQLDALGVDVVVSQNMLIEFQDEESFGKMASSSEGRRYISFEDIYRLELKSPKRPSEIRMESVAVYMNTSATSGSFKTVPIKWKQFCAHARASCETIGMSEEDNWLMVLPMFHVGGLAILIRSLFNGTAITVMERFDPRLMLEMIHTGRVNMVSAVPTMLGDIIDDVTKHSLRVLLVGGEFIPDDLVSRCIRMRIPIYKTYGMTETTSQATTLPVLSHPEKILSVGRPLDGVEIRIDAPDDKGVGEILIKGPVLMDGYVGMSGIGSDFRTGDIGRIDEDGFLYVLGRKNNVIISGGENIYPKEIENLLHNHPAVKECAIVPVKDSKWGESPVLYVAASIDEQSIQAYLKTKIAGYKMPREIIRMDELPKNSTGKIMRSALGSDKAFGEVSDDC